MTDFRIGSASREPYPTFLTLSVFAAPDNGMVEKAISPLYFELSLPLSPRDPDGCRCRKHPLLRTVWRPLIPPDLPQIAIGDGTALFCSGAEQLIKTQRSIANPDFINKPRETIGLISIIQPRPTDQPPACQSLPLQSPSPTPYPDFICNKSPPGQPAEGPIPTRYPPNKPIRRNHRKPQPYNTRFRSHRPDRYPNRSNSPCRRGNRLMQ